MGLPWDNSGDTDTDKVVDILDQVSPLFEKIKPLLSEAFSTALSGQFGMPGLTQGYGSTSAFGNQNVGLNMVLNLHNNAVNSAMGDSAENVANQITANREAHIRTFGTGPDGSVLSNEEVKRLANAPLSAIGLTSGTMFNLFQQPEPLLQGVRAGIQYMGVTASPGAAEHQIALRKQTTAMSTAMTNSLIDDEANAKFGFMGGLDRGQLTAELMRTGGFNEIRSENQSAIAALGPNASKEDTAAVMDKLGADTVAITQDAARSIRQFRQFFKGSVTEVMDQVNGFLGTDVAATFDDAGSSMFMRMGATGLATGHTAEQMKQFGSMASQYSSRQGNPLWGSAAAGTVAAQLMGVHRQQQGPYGTNEFIHEETFRKETSFESQGSMHSALAQSIRGAYAYAMDQGGEAGAVALDEALAANPVRSISDVASVAGGALGEVVSPFTLSNWGNMPEARRLMGSDQRSGTIQATMLKAIYEGEGQRRLFELSLGREGGLSSSQVSGIMDTNKGAMTISALMESIPEGLMDTGARWNVAGFMHGRAAMGDTSSEHQQARIAMGLDVETRNLITGNVGSNVQLMTMLEGQGAHGIAGFNAFIAEMDKQNKTRGGSTLGMKDILGQILGRDATNVTTSEVAGFVGASGEMLEALEEHGSDKQKLGLAIVWQGLAQQIGPGGKTLTSAQLKKFQAALAGTEKGEAWDVSDFINFGEVGHDYNKMSFDSDGNYAPFGESENWLEKIHKILDDFVK
jgi:hypothetical protein